ncbi:MAG: hypothetical protein ACYDG4_18200 [Desulfuromonadaceae bacterium]
MEAARSLEVVRPMSLAMPELDLEMATARFEALRAFIKENMRPGIDYGVIPGTGKRKILLPGGKEEEVPMWTLLKPGAEKLCTFFGLTKELVILEEELDWTGKDHEGEPFFYCHYKIRLSRNGYLIAEADGSANSWESKHRYRIGEYKCPACHQATLRRSKEERGGGWYCWTRIGGCGEQFAKGTQSIESQDVGIRKNPDPADLVNTLQKVCYKRALIASTLVAVNASEYFNQDLDDLLSKEPNKGSSTSDNASSNKTSLQGPQRSSAKQDQVSHGQSQDPSGKGNNQSQGEDGLRPMTIPEVVEACKTNKFIPAFPIPLITTKKVAIGEWVNRYCEGEFTHVVFELVPDMEKATGVTQARISKKFEEAGFKVIFQEPGTAKQVPTQEEAIIPPPEQVQSKTANNTGGQSKSFF